MDSKLAKNNFDYCRETAKLKTRSEINLIELGGRLHKIFTEKYYEPNYDSFKDYLEDLKISPATASKLISIHQILVLKFKFRPKFLAEIGGWSSVSEIVSLSETKKEAKEWLNKVKVLNRNDLRKEIMEKKTGILMSKCPHKNIEKAVLKICLDCGDKWRDYEGKE